MANNYSVESNLILFSLISTANLSLTNSRPFLTSLRKDINIYSGVVSTDKLFFESINFSNILFVGIFTLIDTIRLLLCLSTLFALVNPLGITPIFVAMTEKYSHEDQIKIAKKGVITGTLVLLVFTFLGSIIAMKPDL